jgi:hypothetical protein
MITTTTTPSGTGGNVEIAIHVIGSTKKIMFGAKYWPTGFDEDERNGKK